MMTITQRICFDIQMYVKEDACLKNNKMKGDMISWILNMYLY